NDPYRALALMSALVLLRWWIAYPKAFTFCRHPNLRLSLRNGRRPEAIAVGLVWAAMGFLGSFGMNGPFHRILWEVVFLFRSVRVPARCAMVAAVGLALLAGIGAVQLARA